MINTSYRTGSVSDPDSLEESLLSHDENISRENKRDGETAQKHIKRLHCRLFYILPWATNVVLLAALVWISRLYSISHCNMSCGSNNMLYSPAQHLIESQNVLFSAGLPRRPSLYQGPSTPERDEAWEELYRFGISRIPRSSAAKLVTKTVPIPGDPGHYVIQLDVFHQLHCVNMLRLRLWSNETLEPEADQDDRLHLSHCIDSLRQSIMCSADVTPIPWVWVPEEKRAKGVLGLEHTCRNFEKIRLWAKENQVKSFDRTVYVEDDLNP